jgi:agmatine/peptidylarginine deiminase
VRPGEFAPMDSVMLTIINMGQDYEDMWTEMLEVFTQAGHAWIIASATTQDNYAAILDGVGVDASTYSFLNYPVDTIWMRDYGPEFVIDGEGERYIFDTYYYGRPLDDVVPIRVGASDWINTDGNPLEVNSSGHYLSGGNVMSDGAGTCFFSDILYSFETPAGWTDQDVDDHLAEYLGCEQMIVLNPICLDGTGHVDLFAKVMGPTSVLLGEFPADTHFHGETAVSDPWNCTDPEIDDHQDMEDNLAIIEATTNLDGESWQVTRIPMLEPYLDEGYWIYRSYLNSQLINNHVAMPTYHHSEGSHTTTELLDLEAAAIAAYETALPGVEVTAIDADHIIVMGGAFHCITHEIPTGVEGWEAPATYCGDSLINGDEECDGEEFGDATCLDFGLAEGDLSCDEYCEIDPSGCSGGDVDTDVDTDADVDGDAGPGDGGGSDDDCGCRVVGSRGLPTLLALLRSLFG